VRGREEKGKKQHGAPLLGKHREVVKGIPGLRGKPGHTTAIAGSKYCSKH